MERAEELIRELQKGLLFWYDFRAETKALYIGRTEDALVEMLADRGIQVECVSCLQSVEDDWKKRHQKVFDYLICVEELEKQQEPERFLRVWKELLSSDGRMFLGMNNRLGFRYFCGDRDPYTERNFDGIDGYRNAVLGEGEAYAGRCYSRAEVFTMLQEAGLEHCRFYSVFSDLKNPTQIFAQDYLPREDLANRVLANYHYPKSVFLEEECLYQSLIDNGMFHAMANAYLVECSVNGRLSEVNQVTATMDRGRERAILTIIYQSGVVEKRAAYPEGQRRLEKLIEHGKDLAAHGIRVVEAKIKDGVYVMPFMEAETGQVYLKRLLQTDREAFLGKMDHFRDLIMQSSEIVQPDAGDGMGAVMRKGYLEMVPLNSFHSDGSFAFYDQEYSMDTYPANAIVARMIATFYAGNDELEKILPSKKLYERYGLWENLGHWRSVEWKFLSDLRKDKELQQYHTRHRRDESTVRANRQQMNFAADEYRRLFIDIFEDADTRKLILFGSGAYAQRFFALYSMDYPVYAVLDNNREKWGQEISGVQICGPQLLQQFDPAEYKVLICVKRHMSIIRQLEEMGAVRYSVFDPWRSYPRKRRSTLEYREANHAGETPKKYHVGYIAGVFDLFHIGHLNMFRRAKEQCDYLIAGVVTDEGVRRFKRVEPFIPYEERAEMVRACRYVDEVVEIPLLYGDTEDAWRMHHFDVQFSGSDYINDARWLEKKAFLEANGAEMVFFSYTETTSSSKIKALIEKKIL